MQLTTVVQENQNSSLSAACVSPSEKCMSCSEPFRACVSPSEKCMSCSSVREPVREVHVVQIIYKIAVRVLGRSIFQSIRTPDSFVLGLVVGSGTRTAAIHTYAPGDHSTLDSCRYCLLRRIIITSRSRIVFTKKHACLGRPGVGCGCFQPLWPGLGSDWCSLELVSRSFL